jgi:hypothetical protein
MCLAWWAITLSTLFHGRLPRGATDRPSSDTPTWPAHHRRYRIEAAETITGRLGPMPVVSLCHCLPPPSSLCLTRQAPTEPLPHQVERR